MADATFDLSKHFPPFGPFLVGFAAGRTLRGALGLDSLDSEPGAQAAFQAYGVRMVGAGFLRELLGPSLLRLGDRAFRLRYTLSEEIHETFWTAVGDPIQAAQAIIMQELGWGAATALDVLRHCRSCATPGEVKAAWGSPCPDPVADIISRAAATARLPEPLVHAAPADAGPPWTRSDPAPLPEHERWRIHEEALARFPELRWEWYGPASVFRTTFGGEVFFSPGAGGHPDPGEMYLASRCPACAGRRDTERPFAPGKGASGCEHCGHGRN